MPTGPGAEAAGTPNGPAIQEKLAEVSSAGTAFGSGDFAAAVEAIKAGGDIDYAGASGDVDFDGQGDVVAPDGIWKVQGGSITTLENAVSP